MPHAARKKSASGYYHVVPKGIHDQIIFENDTDRRIYLELMRQAKRETGLRIHAYALMSNHVHFVLEDEHDMLSAFMKMIDERYGKHVAEETGRKGGILVRPFWSEPIETENYLLCAVRYVHANPAVAGICPASAYEWSSAKDYLGRSGITDTDTVLDLLGGREGFISWSQACNMTTYAFPGSRLKGHLKDDELVSIAKMLLGNCNISSRGIEERNEAIRLLIYRGFSNRQISRVCGVGRGVVESVRETCQKGLPPVPDAWQRG